MKNLVVPVVGNFGGPKAVRAVGQYVRDHGASVDAFYVSEVEPYLMQDGLWSQFCQNVAALPLVPESVFIRPPTVGPVGPASTLPLTPASPVVAPIATDLEKCRR